MITLKILDQIFVSSTYRKQGSSFFSCLYNEFVVDRKKYYVHSKEKKIPSSHSNNNVNQIFSAGVAYQPQEVAGELFEN